MGRKKYVLVNIHSLFVYVTFFLKRKMLRNAMENFLTHLEAIMEQTNLTLPQLFHLHTLQSGNLITCAKMTFYEHLMDHFLSICRMEDNDLYLIWLILCYFMTNKAAFP